MSYTDLLQSYQDKLSSMVENEDSVGDYLLNKSQEKINAYLEKTGIPAEIGGVIDQIGILSNNSAVKTVLEKSGIKGVFSEQVETLNRSVGELKGQIQAIGDRAAAAVDRQVVAAQNAARPVLEQSQRAIDTAAAAETQTRAAVQTAQQLPAQIQDTAAELGERAQGAAAELGERAQGAVENLTQNTAAAVERTVEQPIQRLTPEYLQNLSDDELKDALRQVSSRRAALGEQFQRSELPNREEVFNQLKQQTRAERSGYMNEAERRGLYQREQPATQPETQGVVEEPNVRPSQVARDTPEFQDPSQQLPQVPRQQPPGEPEAPTEPEAPVAPRPAPPSEIEPAIGPQPRPEGYIQPTEEGETVAQEGEAVAQVGERTEQAISTTAKVGTTLEETTGSLPGIGEIGEVFGALLQIGSLIASAFKPHEDVQTISTPISGFGFGANNQFGVGGSSIV